MTIALYWGLLWSADKKDSLMTAEFFSELPDSLKTKVVLLVEDTASIRGVERSILSDLGFRKIHEATNGEEAFKLIKHHKVDIIICDWEMPRLNGLELLKRIKSENLLDKKIFIMVTSASDSARVKTAISEGVHDYLVKPFQPQVMVQKLLGAMQRMGAEFAAKTEAGDKTVDT
jgi:two-component system chemotaxis response regulator CheY